MRSHPPTLETLAQAALGEVIPARSPATTVQVAVSGGPDSMALLHVMSRLRDELGFRLVAHGVDHGLRPEASHELDRAEELSKKLRVPWSRTVTVVAPGGNLQARARVARYEALRRAAARDGAAFIATAHHADDRAETVLLRILRGSSPRGLGVLPPREGELLRPLIRARRTDIVAHVERHQLPYAVDPSNADPRFLRARVRTEVLPLLESLSPGIVAHLTALADELYGEPPVALARGARTALRALAASRSPTARVRIAHDLVVAYEPLGRRDRK